MSCFWDGLLDALRSNDRIPSDRVRSASDLVRWMRARNRLVFDVEWNGHMLTKQQVEENYRHVASYDPRTIRSGYLCSTCDPFLFLFATLFRFRIEHRYLKSHVMIYEPIGGDASRLRVARFESDSGHFWFVRPTSTANRRTRTTGYVSSICRGMMS